MADTGQNARIEMGPEERFKYIGFDVFPGTAGDIFTSEDEKRSLIQKVRDRLAKSAGQVRDRCTLMEDRISTFERNLMTVASVILTLSIFIPWFSGYFEHQNVREVPVTITTSEGGEEQSKVEMQKIIEVVQENRSLTGIGALFSLGSYGGQVFSSGFFLMLSGVLMLVYFLSCIALGAYNLYLLFGVKIKGADEYALFLKSKLNYNWYPVMIWIVMLLFSIVGASYGFRPEGMVKQVGDSYSLATFLGLSSFGIYVSLSAFLVLALKGKEI